jgi:sugar phosphate isomerase/epimerase
MITISAFGDEIAPDLKTQIDVCEASGVKCIDVRGIDKVNVSQMPLEKVREYKRLMDGRGFSVPCIGSPLGKIRMDEDFAAHLELLKRTCEIAKAFGTDRIRVFSFYPSKGKKIAEERAGVMKRLEAMVKLAESAGVVLHHENERDIYGAKTEGVKDIFATIRSKALKGIFDPANFVAEGLRPFEQCWKAGLDALSDYFHIKDLVPGAETCVPAGEGQGQIPEILADLARRSGKNWTGHMTLEPHMSAAGRFSGFTGPQLFAKAAAALKRELDKAGLKHG